MKYINYTKNDIIRKLSYNLNMGYEESKLIFDCTLNTIENMFLDKSEKIHIELRNFGTFNIYYTNERTNARNPKTKERVIIPRRKKIVFKPSKSIKEKLYKK